VLRQVAAALKYDRKVIGDLIANTTTATGWACALSWTSANTRSAFRYSDKDIAAIPLSDTTFTVTGTTRCCLAACHSEWTLFLREPEVSFVAGDAGSLRASLPQFLGDGCSLLP
jgi:hypothetical protein